MLSSGQIRLCGRGEFMRKLVTCLFALIALSGGSRVVAQSTPPAQTQTPPPSQTPPPAPAAPAAQNPLAKAPIPSSIIQRIIVKVNGEIFTQTELVQRQADALRADNQDVKDPKALQDDARLAAKITALTPQILLDVVDELLMVQRGRELGIKFTDQNFKNALENVKKQNNLNDDGLKTAMEQAGLTLEELRQNFERTWIMQGVQQSDIMGNMRLTEEEARQYYQKHPEEFMKPATLALSEIFVSVPAQTDSTGQPTFNVGADDAAKEKITKARERVLAGEDFAKVVGEVSEAGSKANGGKVGTVVVDEMVSNVRDALTKLKPGEMSEPLRFPTGYRVFKLDARAPAQLEPFESVRETIGQKIYQERLGGEQKKYIEKLRAQALIEWKDDGYKQMYEKALAERDKAGLPGSQS